MNISISHCTVDFKYSNLLKDYFSYLFHIKSPPLLITDPHFVITCIRNISLYHLLTDVAVQRWWLSWNTDVKFSDKWNMYICKRCLQFTYCINNACDDPRNFSWPKCYCRNNRDIIILILIYSIHMILLDWLKVIINSVVYDLSTLIMMESEFVNIWEVIQHELNCLFSLTYWMT